MGETHFGIPGIDTAKNRDEADFEVEIDFDLETYCRDRKTIVYPTADIASDPEHSQDFLDLTPGKAILQDMGKSIRFKDRNGNLAEIQYDEALLETLCPRAYAEYTKVSDKLRENETRNAGSTTLLELRGMRDRRRDELLDQLKTKFAEMGFDFRSQEETEEAFESAGRAWSTIAADKYRQRHNPGQEIQL